MSNTTYLLLLCPCSDFPYKLPPPQMKDSEDSLLNKIKDLSEKLDAKRTGLSNIQWTNDLAVLKSCLEDVEKIQNDINALEVGGYWAPFYISNFSRNSVYSKLSS